MRRSVLGRDCSYWLGRGRLMVWDIWLLGRGWRCCVLRYPERDGDRRWRRNLASLERKGEICGWRGLRVWTLFRWSLLIQVWKDIYWVFFLRALQTRPLLPPCQSTVRYLLGGKSKVSISKKDTSEVLNLDCLRGFGFPKLRNGHIGWWTPQCHGFTHCLPHPL